jgi:SAM-dependent methyltransferase
VGTVIVLKVIRVVVLTAIGFVLLISQCRKPKWWIGRLYVRMMNRTHAALTRWGLTHVSIGANDTILDVGCGGGRTIHSLALAAPSGRVDGIDHSEQSVAVARKLNADLIAAGRVDVQHASVSCLPFPDSTFDLATAVETFYYWPDPVSDLREVLRVLKPGGRLVVIAEVFRRKERDKAVPLVMKFLGGTCPSAREVKDQFIAAGFADVETSEEARHGWLCATASRPAT